MSGDANRKRPPSRRRSARRLALQALYQWILTENDPADIARQMHEDAGKNIDREYFNALFPAVAESRCDLDRQLEPLLDERKLDPVEQAVLWLGAFELSRQTDVPYRAVINESVELARTFGATDGYKYVNAVLDKLAPRLRGAETESG